jgi:protein-S-isoprenylcysteine O-methyltransferase Ste14
MKKLNYMGIGPKIGGIVLPWLAVAIFITIKFKSSFAYLSNGNRILFFSGLALVTIGSAMYFLTAPALLKGLKETRLITNGTYYLCRNPLYASIIIFIIPGISLMMNSWLILTTSIAGIILCKTFIQSEYAEMEYFFGDDFRNYRAETPEFLPFPVMKWFRRRHPAPVWQHITLLSILAYEGAGAILGGSLLVAAPDGRIMDMHVEIMHGFFSDFLIPGLILIGLGVLNTTAFFTVLRRSRTDWLLASLAMGGLAIWFIVEIMVLRELHWLHAMWGLPVLAGCLLTLPMIPFRRTILLPLRSS